MFENAEDVKTYALAGRAIVTLTSQRTQARYTYKVSQAKDESGEPKPLWFVALLTGPDNEADYQYMGTLNGTFRLTSKSHYKADSVPVRAFNFFWRNVDAGRMPPEMEIRHEGTCGRCGRTLTVPESIDSGFGPECVHKVHGH